MTRRVGLAVAILVAGLALSGCDSAEERAEKHYQSALTLLAGGDADRALVELRNVFALNGFHKEARRLYADTQRARGELAEAYGQYLRLIEQYPDTADVRLILAEMAIAGANWDEAERHGREAARLAPDLPGIASVTNTLDYRAAVIARDDAARAAAAAQARDLLAAAPGDRLARRVVIDFMVTGDAPRDAMDELDRAIVDEPDQQDYYDMKLRLLAADGDEAAIGAHLALMLDRFPQDERVRSIVIRWHLSRNDLDAAEQVMRRLAGDPTGPVAGQVTLVQLLQRARGSDAARAELDRLIAANAGRENALIYRAMKAGLDFDAGDRDGALAAVDAMLATAPPSDAARRVKILQARMLAATGNRVGARARIEEVLAEDRSNVEALKMRAAWLIESDRPGDAIIDLRTALDQTPRDPDILILMAEAHQRDGAPELAGERLALAVEVSGSAPDAVLRHARFLLEQGRVPAAVAVLGDARRANRGNLEILTLLADQYLATQDWLRAAEIGTELRAIGTPAALDAAGRLAAAILLGQNRSDEALALLESAAAQSPGNIGAVLRVVQARLRAGQPEDARAFIDAEIAARPGEPGLRLVSAALHGMTGNLAEAEPILRDLIARDPGAEPAVRLLHMLLTQAGRNDEASEVLAAGLAARPASPLLGWMRAGELERAGDIDGAIAVYETLYAGNTDNVVIANNLASMIATHRTDAESLERAFAIARRLRGTDVPAFQDTYGWIEYRRGNLTEALAYLEPAAAGLPDDPLVQYHLGMTYAGLDRPADARRQLARALDLAGDSPLPQFETARQTLAGLP